MANKFSNDEINELKKNMSEQNVRKFAGNHLSKNELKQLEDILSDKNRLKDMLNSPKAKELMKKLGGNNGN